MTIIRARAAALALLAVSAPLSAREKAINPKVAMIVDEVSEERIRAIIARLESFGTRNTMSNEVAASREWIFEELRSYSPKLQVKFDKHRVKKQGQRIFKDVDLWNVVAVLPGTKYPEAQVLVSGHYDSLNLGTRPAAAANTAGGDAPPISATAQMTPEEFEKNAELPAPGACDDGSGTAAVMELARVMSQYEFDKTLVFVAFAGEEQGLIGSSLLASKAKKENQVIEAVLNNDIIGTDIAGNRRMSNNSVNIYSDETMDSVSQQLSRYAREIGQRYIPSMRVDTIFMGDRLARGGDHTPFQWEGFAAVRISTPNENYAHQHRGSDTLANMSVPYTTKVAKVNAAVAASLALAPRPPIVMRAPQAGRGGTATNATNGATASAGGRGGRAPTPMISRGQSGYDADLQWRPNGPDADIQGYAIVMRPTTSPYWEQEIYVGKVTRYTMKDVSIDDVKFGVKAIGNDGSESLVTPYLYPPRQKTEIQTVEQ